MCIRDRPETADKTWGNALYECFDQKVEEKLIQPTFITMHLSLIHISTEDRTHRFSGWPAGRKTG